MSYKERVERAAIAMIPTMHASSYGQESFYSDVVSKAVRLLDAVDQLPEPDAPKRGRPRKAEPDAE